ncbi:MAG: hypothetical protein KGQ52_04350 [Alphaproteobacteria bacterium]|nr:hypothetical protein [Alphaproteobacteria bacterium]
MITRRSIDRLTIATLVLAAAMPFMAISPVQAAPVDCAAQAQSIAARAGAADPKAAARALRTARLAAKICEEGNGHEAAKKFRLAQSQLGTSVQLAERR